MAFIQFLGILSHVDLSTSPENDVLQILVLTELLRSIRCHENTLDIIVLDNLSQIIKNGVDTLTHNLLVLRVLMMRDESFDYVASGPLVLDILCQSHTTRHGTIDEHTDSTRIRESHVIECLHEDAQSPHKEGRYQVDEENTRRIEMHEQVTRQL